MRCAPPDWTHTIAPLDYGAPDAGCSSPPRCRSQSDQRVDLGLPGEDGFAGDPCTLCNRCSPFLPRRARASIPARPDLADSVRASVADDTARVPKAAPTGLAAVGLLLGLFRSCNRSCQRCQSLRVPVSTFRPSRSQRRVWKANRDAVTIRIGPRLIQRTSRRSTDRPPASARNEGLASGGRRRHRILSGQPVPDAGVGLLPRRPSGRPRLRSSPSP